MELLQKTFTEIGGELNLDKVFEIVSVQARELINAESLLIPLLDDDLETYTYRAGSGKNIDEIIGESMPLDFGVCGWVWKHKQPWWQGMYHKLDVAEQQRWKEESGTIILVPLQGPKRFLGGIAGIGKVGGGRFSQRDLNVLQLFASIVSIAIENALVVKSMEASNQLNKDYQQRLAVLNRQLVESSKELEHLALHDTVTNLPNRSLFHDRLAQNIGQANLASEHVGLLLIDLDQFKKINEAFGHQSGDLLLKKVAARFMEEIRSTETLARLGGDEFVVILPRHDEKLTMQRAATIRALLDEAFAIENTDIVVTASIGVTVYPEHANDLVGLLSHADTAMYAAKSKKTGICLYQAEMDHQTRNHLTMMADIRNALENNDFELYYQPKIHIKSDKVLSAEALGRWTSKTWGAVPPTIFIEILEQTGLIGTYTFWAISTALKQAKHWSNKNAQFRIAVNLSPATLMHPDFIRNLEHTLKESGDGQYLAFEITENLFLSEYDRLLEVLEYVAAVGIQLSIDDYGTGYSSLSRLKKLPVAELKIDQSFIQEMNSSTDDEAIVRSTIELAHNLGLTVVAEGVETPEALQLLRKLGCDTVQGYLIAKPLPVNEFDTYLLAYHH